MTAPNLIRLISRGVSGIGLLFLDGVANLRYPVIGVGVVARTDMVNQEHRAVVIIAIIRNPCCNGFVDLGDLIVAALVNSRSDIDRFDSFENDVFGILMFPLYGDLNLYVNIAFFVPFVMENREGVAGIRHL